MRILIILEGGLIREVYDGDTGDIVDYTVFDFDTEGLDPLEVYTGPVDDYRGKECIVGEVKYWK